jgi:solute carrier family 45 protein 1/2/4
MDPDFSPIFLASDATSTDGKLLSPPPIHALPPNITDSTFSESSPLLRPPRSSDLSPSPFPDQDDEWAPPLRSTWYLIWLTLIMAGIQISWSVELAYISPYLLSLGLPKSTLSLVWMAGPISGVIVQPLIGMMSDRSTFKWGRRRIFIVIASVFVVLGFIGMGRTKSIVRWCTGPKPWEEIRDAVVVLAVASLIILDLAINAGISAQYLTDVSNRCREGVDCRLCPHSPAKYCQCMGRKDDRFWKCHGISKVVLYHEKTNCSGYINLPKYLPSLGDTQFGILCVLAPISLVVTVLITCATIKEVDPALLFVSPEDLPETKTGLQATLYVLLNHSF